MKSYKGSATIALLLVLGILLTLAATVVFTYIHYKDRATTFEVDINKDYRSAQNYLSSFTVGMKDAIGLKNLDVSHLERLIVGRMKAQQGEDGSQAMMQWFQQENIPYDNELARRMLDMISSGRAEYRLHQEKLNQNCSVYKTELKLTWSGFWYNLADKPEDSKDFSLDMCDLVLDADTNEAYRTKEVKSISFQ
jgi:hypothetical protein